MLVGLDGDGPPFHGDQFRRADASGDDPDGAGGRPARAAEQVGNQVCLAVHSVAPLFFNHGVQLVNYGLRPAIDRVPGLHGTERQAVPIAQAVRCVAT